MLNFDEIIRQLSSGAEAIHALTQNVPAEQARWKPDSQTWSLQETMAHLYNEERLDFRKHLKEMLSDPPQPWQRFDSSELVVVESLEQVLDGFLSERGASLAWLKALESPDWNITIEAPWGGPICAGDVLGSWAAHDYLHLRQINELLFAWNAQHIAPYSVKYAGDW